MPTAFEIPKTGAVDFLALGALIHRLDPGIIPFRKASSCSVHVSGGEFNCTANLADCFGMRTAIATAMVSYPIGELIQGQVRAMGVTPYYKMFKHDGVRGPNMAAVYSDRGFGIRGPVVFYNRSNEAAAQLKPGDFDWDGIFATGVRWFHSGGIFASLSETTAELIIEAMKAAKKHGAIVSFDRSIDRGGTVGHRIGVEAMERALADAWRRAEPFPHLVVDDFATDVSALFAVIEEEAVERYEGDIFRFEASAPEPTTQEFRELRDGFAAALAPRLSRITGKQVSRVDMRAYAYRPGHYLLPHSDHRDGLSRALAYAYYLPSPEPPRGGELELFTCRVDGGEIVATESALMIEPRGNRLVVFDVSDVSLHQVREVLAGLRISLAGWFYP